MLNYREKKITNTTYYNKQLYYNTKENHYHFNNMSLLQMQILLSIEVYILPNKHFLSAPCRIIQIIQHNGSTFFIHKYDSLKICLIFFLII